MRNLFLITLAAFALTACGESLYHTNLNDGVIWCDYEAAIEYAPECIASEVYAAGTHTGERSVTVDVVGNSYCGRDGAISESPAGVTVTAGGQMVQSVRIISGEGMVTNESYDVWDDGVIQLGYGANFNGTVTVEAETEAEQVSVTVFKEVKYVKSECL